MDWTDFARRLAGHAKRDGVSRDDVLFRSGLDLSSIAFTEFILDLEEAHDLDIDVDDLDASIETVGQLFDRIAAAA